MTIILTNTRCMNHLKYRTLFKYNYCHFVIILIYYYPWLWSFIEKLYSTFMRKAVSLSLIKLIITIIIIFINKNPSFFF